jgi:hypothetical protein
VCCCLMKLQPGTWAIHFDLAVSLAEIPVPGSNQVLGQVGTQPESLDTQGDSMVDIRKPEGEAERSHHMVHLALRIPFGPLGGQTPAAGGKRHLVLRETY